MATNTQPLTTTEALAREIKRLRSKADKWRELALLYRKAGELERELVAVGESPIDDASFGLMTFEYRVARNGVTIRALDKVAQGRTARSGLAQQVKPKPKRKAPKRKSRAKKASKR